MTTTPRLGITQLEEGQALPEVVVNEGVLKLEQGANSWIVKDKDIDDPPGSPAEGDAYIVATASPSGAWTGWGGRIAYYANGTWEDHTPIEGTSAYVQDENLEYTYDGSAWAVASYLPLAGGTLTGDLVVPAEAYGAGWNGSNEVPTKNDVYDKIEAVTAGAATFRGALAKKAADQTGANYTSLTVLTWDNEGTGCYDTDSIHDTSTNPGRMTVPSSSSYVRLDGNVRIDNKTAADWVQIIMHKNGAVAPGLPNMFFEPGSAQVHWNFSSAPIPVSPGDFFEMKLQVESDTAIDINAALSWFGMQVIY